MPKLFLVPSSIKNQIYFNHLFIMNNLKNSKTDNPHFKTLIDNIQAYIQPPGFSLGSHPIDLYFKYNNFYKKKKEQLL